MAKEAGTKKPSAKKTAAKKAVKKKTGKTESHEFQAEVSKLLQMMVHSVYSEREIFLRELISNSADACDKLRYEAIQNPDLMGKESDLGIAIAIDKKARTVMVGDNGIGMNHEELIDNLGTIARSGTQAFMEKNKDGESDVNLIGQFGIGFYSAFMVAEKVEVVSHKAGEDKCWKWVSDGTGSYTIEEATGDDARTRGTEISLHMREDAEEFLEEFRIEQIVKTYSDHITYPIALDGDEPRQLNAANAIWTRAKSDISPEQYKEFFGSVSGVFSDPAMTLHYKAEGLNEYTVLLFVPGERPYDLFDPERRGKQKLYVRRVFITDEAEMLPAYLRFVRGVIDSEDMPLNLSREMLQHNPTVAKIRKAVTGKVLSELTKHAENEPESYAKIWESFGPVIKEGIYEDMERRDALFELARFRTLNSPDGETVTLKQYVAAMKENQTAIYYVTGESPEKVMQSPQLEGYKARGLDVLLLSDPVDSFWVQTALGYEGKPFKSITQGADDLANIEVDEKDKKDKPEEAGEDEVSALLVAMKEVLGDEVQEVRKSIRLTDSPVCIVASETGLDRNLEKILAAQKSEGVSVSAPILEINAANGLIKALAKLAKKDKKSIDDAAHLLLDQAYILEGDRPADSVAFAKRMSEMMTKVFA
jgi:molecular chaperone HtpG